MDPAVILFILFTGSLFVNITAIPKLFFDLRDEMKETQTERDAKLAIEKAYAELLERHTDLLDNHHETQRVLRAMEFHDTLNETLKVDG